MTQTQVAVNGATFSLAPGEDVGALKRRIVDAVRADGGFVEFAVAGSRQISVLFTARTQAVFLVETVQLDPWDGTEEATSFGGSFDFL
jgi:hypothetical protein